MVYEEYISFMVYEDISYEQIMCIEMKVYYVHTLYKYLSFIWHMNIYVLFIWYIKIYHMYVT